MAPRSSDEVVVQLAAAGLEEFIRDVRCEGHTVHGVIGMRAVVQLRNDPRFAEGGAHHLHPNVGRPRTEFRSNRGALGRGSLQIVVNLVTGVFEADVDRFNMQDLVNVIGHGLLEVLPGLFTRKTTEGEPTC